MKRPGRTRNHFLAGGGCVNDPPQFAAKSVRRSKPIDIDSIRSGPCDRIDEVAIITFHFNPMGYQRLLETYQQWHPSLGPLAESLRCYELVFDDDPPEIEGSIVIRGTRDANLMWQKEAIINRAIKETPPHVRYIVWLDHDIIIRNPRWLEKSIQLIDNGFVAVQLFDRLHYLDRQNMVQRSSTSAMSRWVESKKSFGPPGGSWIADRKYIDAIGGLIDTAIIGSGDQSFFSAMTSDKGRFLKNYSKALGDQHRQWIKSAIEGRGSRQATYLPSTAYHLWHGDRKNRQYENRGRILRNSAFNPLADIRLNQEGIHEWCSDKPAMHQQVKTYFQDRKEDG